MSGLLIALIVFALVVVMWFIGESNRLNRYQVMIEESKRTVDITLVKRYDTISEMLKVAKAYAKHEEKVFSELVALRQGASIQESNQVISNQNDVLAQIRAVGENYPELLSKRIVNSNISQINQAIVTFPTSIVAGIKGMQQVQFLLEDTQGKKDLSDLDYEIH